MSYAETYPARIHAKRLKRKRTLEMRMNAYGSVFNHATVFKDKMPKKVILPNVPKIENRRRLSLWRRIINYFKSFFV